MISNRSRRAFAVVLMIASLGWAANGQDEKSDAVRSPDGPRKLREAWGRLFKRQATDYAINFGTEGMSNATPLAEPIMRWWQPVRGTDDGAIYLWVCDGRPVAAGSIFTIKDGRGARDLVHEFHTLSPGPVAASWRGQFAWDCPAPGLVFSPVPGAPAPADTPSARLRQIHTMARAFSAHSIDRMGQSWELRLLASPLYRYNLGRESRSTSTDVLDGAIVAFVQGTDPEVLVVFEASGRNPDRSWQYAVAPFTDLGLQVRHRGKEVYACPVAVQLEGRHGTHVGFTVKKSVGDDPDAIEAH